MARQTQAHERLDVFLLAKDLVVELYRLTAVFPADEKFGLTSQIRRAGVGIPANIAEGAARRSKREFSRFLLMARGSAVELRLLLEIARDTDCLPLKDFERCEERLDRIFAMVNGLLRRAESRQ